MSQSEPKLRSRLLIGAIAGFAGALVMTSAMKQLRRRSPSKYRHPRTPREIIDATAAEADVPASDAAAIDVATAGHLAFGAAAGSLIAAANPRIGPVTGAVAGAGVWVASHLGWVPGTGILKPATAPPRRRNALLLGVHLVWGAATAIAMRELLLARETILAADDDEDVPPKSRQR